MAHEDLARKPGHASAVDDDQGALPRWRIIGPGLVVAATGVGAADMVATLVAGSRYGYGLLWAVILGVILKIVLVEGAGRYSLATGYTIFEGWRSLGR
jgi:Mn2+/Fe2+ NRAMP family transporter